MIGLRFRAQIFLLQQIGKADEKSEEEKKRKKKKVRAWKRDLSSAGERKEIFFFCLKKGRRFGPWIWIGWKRVGKGIGGSFSLPSLL